MTKLPSHYDKTIKSILKNKLHSKDLQLMSILTMATYDDAIDDLQHKVIAAHHQDSMDNRVTLLPVD